MKKPIIITALVAMIIVAGGCASCKKAQSPAYEPTATEPVGPVFSEDSAYTYCYEQCQFGPRTMNSEAHERCGQWIVDKFRGFGCEVTEQKAALKGYDGTTLRATNIIARHHPERAERVLLCAHWDSRPWADNDPSEENHRQPVMAANDGASGVAVMLEVARLLQADSTLQIGVDFVCFDAEDWGVPQWSDVSAADSWALGAQYWARNLVPSGYKARFGILMDMVGGAAAQFYQEGMSIKYARNIVDKVWSAAATAGFSSYFPSQTGGFITDDHEPVNEQAGIPCIDIVPYYPNCRESSFGPTWHTVNDDMDHIDRNTLKAVGQTIIQVLFSES